MDNKNLIPTMNALRGSVEMFGVGVQDGPDLAAWKGNEESAKRVHSAIWFMYLSLCDCAILMQAIARAEDAKAENCLARMLAVQLHELLDDSLEVIAKGFQLEAPRSPDCRIAKRELMKVKRESYQFLEDIRNTVGAHRDHNVLFQEQRIASVKPKDVLVLGIEVTNVCLKVLKAHVDTVRRTKRD